MYHNALAPSRLFAIILLLFSGTALSIWVAGFMTAEMLAFDAQGLVLFGWGWRDRVTGEATVTIPAISLFNAQEGRFPQSLQQLAEKGLLPSVPTDPYSGAPLI